MQDGFLSRTIDRAVANVRAIRGAPEAIALVVVVAIGISGVGLQYYQERLAELNGRLDAQDRRVAEYRTKLTEAGTQIEKLSTALADGERSLRAAKAMPRSVENRSRGPGI